MIIGITGSIASGKSVVTRICSLLGYETFYADQEAKELYKNPEVAKILNEKIDENFIDCNKPDYHKIADFVFESPYNNKLVTEILYPFLITKINDLKQLIGDKLLFVEAAMLFESGWNEIFDKTICVFADETIRMKRLRLRNQNNYENCWLRTKYQYPDEKKCKMADYVIINDNVTAVLPQLFNIIKHLQN